MTTALDLIRHHVYQRANDLLAGIPDAPSEAVAVARHFAFIDVMLESIPDSDALRLAFWEDVIYIATEFPDAHCRFSDLLAYHLEVSA